MTGSSKPQMTALEEPLFVLRYRRGHVLLRTIVCSLMLLLWLVFALAMLFIRKHGFFEFALALFFELVSIYLLARLILVIFDLMFFKEVRLYHDRMIKAWKLIGERQMGLAEARLEKVFGGIPAKTLCDADTNWFLKPFKGILYFEDLCEPKEAKKLDYLLAALSGRKPQELEQAIVIERLIKDGDAPRVLDNRTLENIDNALLHDYLEEKKFNSEVSLAFIIVIFFLLILPILLLFLGIWWTLK